MENNLNLEQVLEPNISNNLVTGGLMTKNILDLRYYEFLFILIYFLAFIVFIKYFAKTQKVEKKKVYSLIAFHYIFIIFAYLYSLIFVNDTDTFFQYGYFFGKDVDHGFASNNYIVNLFYYLIYFLHLHYFTTFLFIGFFSSIGLLLLYTSFDQILKNFEFNKNLLFLFFFFPSWHFFTSFPGKDSIMLFAIGLFCFYLVKKKYFYLILPMVLIYLVRPHIMFLILTIIIIMWANHQLLKYYKNKIFYIFGIITGLILFLISLKIFNENYFDHIVNFFEKGKMYRSYSNQHDGWYQTGDNILINSIQYLFYPLYDLSSLKGIIVSLENILILSILIKVCINFRKNLFFELLRKKEMVFAILYFVIGVIVLSNFTANVGISVRQKWMMMPFLFLFMIPFLGQFKSRRL